MTWYAIRTAPGAQMPQREYVVETTGRGKGYRIVPSLNPNVSAIERALKDNGFQFYMPCEYRVIRNRSKTATWSLRRFPILHGYVFVADVDDFGLLESLPGVVGTVGSETGEKYQLSVLDFAFLRTKEASSQAEAEAQIDHNRRAAEGRRRFVDTKKLARVKKRFRVGARVSVLWGRAIGRQATIIGWDEDAQLKAIADGLGALGTITIPTDAVKLVA